MPIAPVPAYKSKKWQSNKSADIMLKSDSFILSEVGRVFIFLGEKSFVPRAVPEITLMIFPPLEPIFRHRKKRCLISSGCVANNQIHLWGRTAFARISWLLNTGARLGRPR